MNDLEYNFIKKNTLALTGINLNSYKAPQMQRRLTAYLTRSGQSDWPRFFRLLRTDPVALQKFRDYLTINVSSFFRDWEKYQFLRQTVLPDLLKNRASLRVWSAGCSRGQEAYSVAILLAEAGQSDRSHQVVATDIDQSALAWARAGGPYTAADVEYVSADWRARYLTKRDDSFWVTSALRYQVMFRQHNLLTDSMAGKFDLIVCRNVVIYFKPETKDKLYRQFYESLRPGGVLYVGGTEMISKAAEIGFESIGTSFYRRKTAGYQHSRPLIPRK